MKRRHISTILAIAVSFALFFWLAIPFAMAVMWSMVDPGHPWSYPDILPPKLSFERWRVVWETTSLPTAMLNSYTLAPVAGICTLLLAAPTAYAFGREEFRGKAIAQVVILIPLVLPGFVTAVFFASLLLSLGIFEKYPAVLLGHIVLYMPYAVRILSVSFSQVQDDVVNAARDLGASPFEVFRAAYFPVLKPGIFAAFLIVFVLSIEEFAIAFIVGVPDFTTIPTILFSYLGFEFVRTNAAVVALILVVPNVILMLVLERLLQSANPASVSGKG
ncbi:ABC transporter permease [Primorskyibacter aestuariivivens]|uniref:ABC transporter permease n=1 Tax=Primorskyibacter aestuariivivens TaxID=1888912 RepID=UPI0023002AA9|nr:ABC transporter permease [Primorskyibacter aestuariivivens]MDA7430637.1 ABC transporter permease [Primorskyibacter aestuariivivens]